MAETHQGAAEEPSPEPSPSLIEERLNRGLERAASLFTSVVALLILGLVLVALVGGIISAIEPLMHGHDFARAAIDGLDATFLVIILLEVVHTTLSRGPIARQLQQFLVVGITSAVRSGLEVSAQRGADARAITYSLVLDALAVLVLVCSLWLVRQRVNPPG
jgi:hypothetical protein